MTAAVLVHAVIAPAFTHAWHYLIKTPELLDRADASKPQMIRCSCGEEIEAYELTAFFVQQASVEE